MTTRPEPESEHVENKQSLGEIKAAIETIAAFATGQCWRGPLWRAYPEILRRRK
jgi:hypothetical protein